MRARLLAAAIVLATAPSLGAGTFDPRQVAADAQWVVHVDVDLLRASQAAERFIGPWLASERVQRELAKLRQAIGTDPTRDLHAVTFCGDRLRPNRGAMIVHADVQPGPLVAFLATQPDYRTGNHRTHTIYTWTGRRRGHEHTVNACLFDSSLVVSARERGDLEKALDVLDGKAANLAGSGSPLLAEAPAAAVVQIRAHRLAEASLPFKSPLVHQTELLNIDLGEDHGEAFFHGRVVARSEQSAADIRRVVEGLIAMFRLVHDSDKDAKTVLAAVELNVEQRTVEVRWRGQVEDLIRIIRTQWVNKHGGNR